MCENMPTLHNRHFLIIKKKSNTNSQDYNNMHYLKKNSLGFTCRSFHQVYLGLSGFFSFLFSPSFSFLSLKLERFLLIKNHLTDKKENAPIIIWEWVFLLHAHQFFSKGDIPISRLLLKLQCGSYLCQNCLVCLNCPKKKYAKEAL